MVDTPTLSPGQVEKILIKRVKQEIAQSNITSTRSGNKELSFLIKEVVSAPFASEADVQKAGTAIGQKVAEISRQSDKQTLDAGVVRKLRFKEDWSTAFNLPVAPPAEKVTKKTGKSTQTVVAAPKPEAEAAPAENLSEENIAADSEDDSVTVKNREEAMPNQSPENVSEAAITPETTAVSSQSSEADALLTNESDEATMTADPAEAGLSEEAAATPEAAEAEVLEEVNRDASGTGASTAAPVNPGAAALSNEEPAISKDN